MQNKELLEQMSVDFEKLTGLIQLSAYMMGRINTDNLLDDEETKKNYPFWLESLLDSVADMAKAHEEKFDEIINGNT